MRGTAKEVGQRPWSTRPFSSLATHDPFTEPFTDIEEASAIVKLDGQEHGPFQLHRQRNQPGLRHSMHIFTPVGEYETVLSFKKKGDPATHTFAFTYRIWDRKDLSTPD